MENSFRYLALVILNDMMGGQVWNPLSIVEDILDGDTPEEIADKIIYDKVNLFDRNTLQHWEKALDLAWVEVNEANNLGIRCISVLDKEYPSNLAETTYAVPVLFAQGAYMDSSRSCAIVGARKSSQESLNVCVSSAGKLVSEGAIVVSGGAAGADTAAHVGSMNSINTNATSLTVAFMPCGLMNANAKICQQILDGGGTLVSSFLNKEPIQKHHYFIRNTLIAGMSSAMIASEPGNPSGTQHAINSMMSLERPVAVIRDGKLSEGVSWQNILDAVLSA